MIRIVQAHRNLLYIRLRKIIIPEWMGRVCRWTASLQECLPCLTTGLNHSINRNVKSALKSFDGSNRVRIPGRLRNQSINAFRVELGSLKFLRRRFQKALHSFHILWKIARAFFPPANRATNMPRECPASVAEISALFFARPQKQVSLHLMPPVSLRALTVVLKSVSASLISFVFLF